jgi:hypothetical protein
MSSRFSFGYMGWKNPYNTNGVFAIGRAQASRATPNSNIPYKPHKTQNMSTGSGSRLLKLKQKAARGDAVIIPSNGSQVIPLQGGADPTTVNMALVRARNLGAVAPPKTNA